MLGIARRTAIAMLRGVISRNTFGRTAEGAEIGVYEITNATGAAVRILDYGGIVQALRVPDRAGNLADVVLGGADMDFYLRRHPYFGCITGRVAGRITRCGSLGPTDGAATSGWTAAANVASSWPARWSSRA